MTQFHEGQEVEVAIDDGMRRVWRTAKIIKWYPKGTLSTYGDRYLIAFSYGSDSVFDEEHIRPAIIFGVPRKHIRRRLTSLAWLFR